MHLFKKLYILVKKRLSTLTPLEIFTILTIGCAVLLLIRFYSLRKVWHTIRIEVIGNSWNTNYNPYGYRTPFWLSDKIKTGQTELDSSGKKIAEILDIERYARGNEEDETYLTVKVLTIFNKKTNKYIFKNKALELGTSIELKIGNVFIPGQIIDDDYPVNGYPTKEVIVTGLLRNQEKWVVDQLIPGEKMVNKSNQKTIAEILSVEAVPAVSNIFFNTIKGQVVLKSYPYYQDVSVKVKLTVEKHDGNWYFAGHQGLYIGNGICIYTEKTNFCTMEVQKVEDAK